MIPPPDDPSLPLIDAGHVRVYQYKTLTEAEFAAGNTTNTTSATGDPIIVDGGENWDADTKFWIQLGSDIDGEAWLDESGYSVSLNSDGDRVAIGAPEMKAPVLMPVM
jgi:hypothetical protein